MPLIVGTKPTVYDRPMGTLLMKLLALVAVLLMPIGMQEAAAAPMTHQASMPMQHCPDRPAPHDMKGGVAECTMACAAALPAMDLAAYHSPRSAGQTLMPATAERLQGLHPDTAVPPPKLS